MRRLVPVLVVALVAMTACSTGSSAPAGGKLSVVAAEDFWGSIAKQLGGDRVVVSSLITNPNTDPHDYEPAPSDARAVAMAGYVVVNGIGYDAWASKLVQSSASSKRTVLEVGTLVGLHEGDNPHQWYSPEVVNRVVDRISADYERLRPKDAAYFRAERTAFLTNGLDEYTSLLGDIKRRFGGTPVGASESIFAPMAAALDLDLRTPAAFLDAIAEGNDPTAADKATVDEQIASKAIDVFVFNAQNATPDVQRLVDAARARGIAIATVTETLTPEGATFQAWQTAQLRALEAALAKATGR